MQEDLQNEVQNPCLGCPTTPSLPFPALLGLAFQVLIP
jgi:hypothetical protein